MFYLKIMEDMEGIDDYTDKFIISYLMFVSSYTFVKLSRIYWEVRYE